jgi:hypothetical protein
MTEQNDLPQVIYGSESTTIDINGIIIDCYVLNNKQRVLSQRGLQRAMGMSEGGGTGGMQRFIQFVHSRGIKPFISNELMSRIETPIKYTYSNGMVANGYEATILIDICDAVIESRNSGKLHKQQIHIAQRAESLIRALAKTSIIALIDEATGYQSDINRAKDELHQLLSKFLLSEQAKWIKTFPDEFFEMIFKMKGWDWTKAAKKPQVIGHYINDFIYSRIAPALLDELKKKNPKDLETGNRKSKHFQWLTPDLGHPKLKEHLSGVMALGRASGYDWVSFLHMLDRSYPKFGHTLKILFPGYDVPGSERVRQSDFDRQLKGLLNTPPPKKEK